MGRTNELRGRKKTNPGVSSMSTPTFDLNHCLSVSIKLSRAMGVEHTLEAILVMSSYDCSGFVPRILYSWRALSRCDSFSGYVAADKEIPSIFKC